MKNSALFTFYRTVFICIGFALLFPESNFAQKNSPYFVNSNGVLMERATNKEVAYFGVNYSPSFGHGYRALKQLGRDHKATIDQDVYHLARLGLDAYRIHIWDTEISDSLGNVVDNPHLELFDYLIYKLKERKFKIIVTPMTLYDNGYPDGATKTSGFANYISKGEAPKNKNFRPVLKNYLGQILSRKNRYTGESFINDKDVIAVEIINEPHHWGDEVEVTNYINELAGHVRQSGWSKPVFYNIAENPKMANAVLAAKVDGISFQWYPGGLVGGRALQQNFMPYINDYPIPFTNRKGWDGKALMAYEFDAADNTKNYAYPLMARSFREAGFQWATQFAYDPTPIAAFNSDYQTHYLNLSYTPSRAISMLIAGEVFRQVPRKSNFNNYLADTSFGAFKISHSQNLSELNNGEKFYYSNSTNSSPVAIDKLQHVAGVGSSSVVSYPGSGAYFLDRINNGVWRLEVMPDLIQVSNPFEKPSFEKAVGKIEWNEYDMTINLPQLPANFFVKGVNSGNSYLSKARGSTISITPGTYILSSSEFSFDAKVLSAKVADVLKIDEFYAPSADSFALPVVINHSPKVVEADKDFEFSVTMAGLKDDQPVSIIAYPLIRRAENFTLNKHSGNLYKATVPAWFAREGVIRYWITIGGGADQLSYPGGHKGSPWNWNYFHNDSWKIEVKKASAPITLFKAVQDFENVHYTFAPWSEPHARNFVFDEKSGEMAISLSTDAMSKESLQALGFNTFVVDKNVRVLSKEDQIRIKTKATIGENQSLTITLVNDLGIPFTADVSLAPNQDEVVLKVSAFVKGRMALLPRPYPTFLPYWFEPLTNSSLLGSKVETVQVALMPEKNDVLSGKKIGFSVSTILYEKTPL